MNRFCSFTRRIAGIMLIAAAVLAVPVFASAGERPHVSRGVARFVPEGFVGEGQATHLGHYTEFGSAMFLPTDDPTAIPVIAWSVYTSANGDRLKAVFVGQLNGLTGKITATVTYVGGSGRFNGATGSASLEGQMLPDGTLVIAVKGTIDY